MFTRRSLCRFQLFFLRTYDFQQSLSQRRSPCFFDYAVPCPLNFEFNGVGCQPTASYTGPCTASLLKSGKEGAVLQFDLVDASPAAKAAWSRVCRAPFPCISSRPCASGVNYEEACPTGFYEKASVCVLLQSPFEAAAADALVQLNAAPSPLSQGSASSTSVGASSTEGECAEPFAATLSAEERRLLHERCGFLWPCQVDASSAVKVKSPGDAAAERMRNDAKRDWSAQCPLGWEIRRDGFCLAPPSYTPRSQFCSRQMLFTGKGPEDKRGLAVLCGLDFPFKGEVSLALSLGVRQSQDAPSDRSNCRLDFASPCPLNWRQDREGCLAPADYTGPCKQTNPSSLVSVTHPGPFDSPRRLLLDVRGRKSEGKGHQRVRRGMALYVHHQKL